MMKLKINPAGKLAALLALALILWSPADSIARDLTVNMTAPEKAPVCKAGEACFAKFEVSVRKGFHINSARPADPSLIPSRLSIKAPEGLSVVAVGYPKSQEVNLSALGGKALVYDGQFNIFAKIAVKKGAAPGRRKLEASLMYQACDNQMCHLPTTIKKEFEIEIK